MWRAIEQELIDIFRKEQVPIVDDGGDTVVIDNVGDIIFSVTDLAKQLMQRGIGQGTPR